MLKNIKIGIKMIIIGTVLLTIPTVAIGIITVQKSSEGLTTIEMEQLEKRTQEIALSIYNVLSTEKKVVLEIANLEITRDALTNSGGYTNEQDQYQKLNAHLTRIGNTPHLGDDYNGMFISDTTGIAKASSDVAAVGLDLSTRDYVQKALKGEINIGQPALSKTDGTPFFPIAAPVYDDDSQIIGCSAIIVDLSFIWQIIKDSTIGKTGYTFITDADGLVISHPDSSIIFETNIADLDGFETIYQRFIEGEDGFDQYVYKGVPKSSGFFHVEETGWGVFLALSDSEFLEPVNQVRNTVIIVGTVGVLLVLLVFILFSRTLTKPIQMGVRFAREMSEGKLYTNININQKDEIGELAQALNDMKEKLKDVVENVYEASIQVTDGSIQLSQSAEQLSQGATEQAANAEEVSSSVEEMGANIQQNTDNATLTEQISSKVAVDAEEGGTSVLDAVTAMNEIANRINIIGDIARQTNMLALNASIEAARAGEHGKGFAVVAAEVGKLAAVSQQAAGEILDLATKSVEKANEAGTKIKAIVPDIQQTAQLVAEISASSKEQNAGAEQINQAMYQLDQVIQMNASSAEEASAMSEELTGQAENLRHMIGFFQIE